MGTLCVDVTPFKTVRDRYVLLVCRRGEQKEFAPSVLIGFEGAATIGTAGAGCNISAIAAASAAHAVKYVIEKSSGGRRCILAMETLI